MSDLPEFTFKEYQVAFRNKRNHLLIVNPSSDFIHYHSIIANPPPHHPQDFVLRYGDKIVIVKGVKYIDNVERGTEIPVRKYTYSYVIESAKNVLKEII